MNQAVKTSHLKKTLLKTDNLSVANNNEPACKEVRNERKNG